MSTKQLTPFTFNSDSTQNFTAVTVNVNNDGVKTPRLPRWTRHEIFVLIQAKRETEGNNLRRTGNGTIPVSEPKWTAISIYCGKHGVKRSSIQCRKRWGNLSGDYKKIKEWEVKVHESNRSCTELTRSMTQLESFWDMRNDTRKEKGLPGFYDREIYDKLDGETVTEIVTTPVLTIKEDVEGNEEEDEDEEVFKGGQSVGEEVGRDEDIDMVENDVKLSPGVVHAAVPISERRFELVYEGNQADEGNARQEAINQEKGSTSQSKRKRRQASPEDEENNTYLQEQMLKTMEQNNAMLVTYLQAQKTNSELDRQQRKDQSATLLGILNKLADAVTKIADKL